MLMLVIKATLSHSSVTKIISLAWSSGFSFPCLWGFWRTLERGNVFGSRSGNFSLLTMICKIYNVWVRRSIYKNTFILSVTRDFNLQFHDWDYQSWSFTSVHVSSPSLSDQTFLFTFVSTLNAAFSVAVDFNERSFGGDEVEEPPRLQTSVHSAAQTALKSWTALPSLAQTVEIWRYLVLFHTVQV